MISCRFAAVAVALITLGLSMHGANGFGHTWGVNFNIYDAVDQVMTNLDATERVDIEKDNYDANSGNINRKLMATMALCSSLTLTSIGDCACAADIDAKSKGLPVSEMSKIIADDITTNQALITADFTRSIYSEDCKFQDEIDTYPIDQYVKGTKALFDASLSHVDLKSDVSFGDGGDDKFRYRFSEVLAFNVPFKPKVSLSGRVELTRGQDGLISYSREFWDKQVGEVLKGIYF